ncbi:hypothetical protein E2C01_034621 [Portunus trituberculatus]|uniref:Endonuclease/exonuclease/phosphatase domain-containing protein n=1 Tax=Portunus trituberculatus TaxID=210409 RepID=A0A5B7F213_PORTR|nr:hypothetical protein [Portunus trituberculatus]
MVVVVVVVVVVAVVVELVVSSSFFLSIIVFVFFLFVYSIMEPVDDPKCLDTSLNFFFINFCNIRGLRSNFPSVENHLSSSKPHLLFLTETQLSEAIPSSPFGFDSTVTL